MKNVLSVMFGLVVIGILLSCSGSGESRSEEIQTPPMDLNSSTNQIAPATESLTEGTENMNDKVVKTEAE